MTIMDRYFPLRPSFQVLDEEKRRLIHLSTLEVLEKTGVEVYDKKALSLLKEAGCFVKDKRVRIPSDLLKWALSSVPERVAIRNRAGDDGLFLENSKPYFGTGSDCPYTLDLETRKRRKTNLQDVASLAKLIDYLPHLDFVMSMALPQEIEAEIQDIHSFATMVKNTKKPIVFTALSRGSLKTIYEICTLIRGGEDNFRNFPFVVHYSEPTSPLMHTQEAVEKLLFCAEKGIPVVYTPGIMAGSTAPITLAGTIVTANAESLSGLLMHQLKRKGSPFIYGAFITIMDMTTTLFSYGAPELSLMSAAMAEMAHFYHLPAWSQASTSDSKTLDMQLASEYTTNTLIAGLSGANLIHDCGYLESGLSSSHESIILADEIIGMTKRILGGIKVNEETLATTMIHKVGPGGNFLLEEYTLKQFRKEFWFPKRFDRNRYDKWVQLGGNDLKEKLNQEAKDILGKHIPSPLDSGVKKRIQEILKGVEEK